MLWLDAGTIMQAPAHGGVTGYLEPLVFAAALAALPCAAERNAVYILRCLRHCITGAATAPQGDTLLAACWQTVQQGALAPLVATVTSENDTQTPLVLLMAATCQQSLLLMKRSTLPPPCRPPTCMAYSVQIILCTPPGGGMDSPNPARLHLCGHSPYSTACSWRGHVLMLDRATAWCRKAEQEARRVRRHAERVPGPLLV